MATFRSYFASELDFLKSSITDLLALNSDSLVDEIVFHRFLERFEGVSLILHNRNFSDLIRKK